MTAPVLRPYQTDFVAEFDRTVAAGTRRILGVAPTGGGKTVIFAEIIRCFVSRYKPVLVLTHRREIITQTSQKLRDLDIPHGIIMAGTQPRPLEAVQVAAIQTLHRRAIHAGTMPLPPADLLVIDEAHHCPANTYRKIIEAYPDAVLLGLTATPCRGDGRGLGGIFQVIIECPQVAELIEQKYLVRTRVYAPVNPDLKGVRTVAGDYNERQLAERMDRAKLVGDIVTHWHKFSERRKTVAFAVNVSHSIHLRDEFIKSGVRAEHIDGSTPKPERDASLDRLASGEIDLITNCMVLTEGWDMPAVSCCILARPTKKMGLFRQMIGRVLRPADGKPMPSCSIIRAPYSGMGLSRTVWNGRLIQKNVPQARPMNSAARTTRRDCSSARNAAPSALLVKRVSIVDSCRSVRRSRLCLPMVSSPKSDVTGAAAATITTGPNGTACWPTSLMNAAISADGSRTSTRKNSAPGRHGAPRHRRFHHRMKSDRGCARA
jgi:superfamily II DNA or RNA helicase